VVGMWRKLQNPFALVGQGFAFGAIIFVATQHQPGEARRDAADTAPPSTVSAAARP
jgi:hypothetical protein